MGKWFDRWQEIDRYLNKPRGFNVGQKWEAVAENKTEYHLCEILLLSPFVLIISICFGVSKILSFLKSIFCITILRRDN